MRFRPEQRLRRSGEIRNVREQGERVDSRGFTLWWMRRQPSQDAVTTTTARIASGARICVIASTAAVGNAVRRNRAKRRLREAFRHQQALAPADCDLLLIARRASVDLPTADLEKFFADACRRIPARSGAR